jgi:hypothetical protein
MTEEKNIIHIEIKINAHYLTAIRVGAVIGGAIGFLCGGVEGFQFVYGGEISHLVTHLVRPEIPIPFLFGRLPFTGVGLWLPREVAGAVVGGVLGAIGGAVIGASISCGLRALYDRTRFSLRK